MGEQQSEGLPVNDNGDDPSVYVANSGKVLSDTGIWNSLSSGLTFLSQYGWYILILAVVLFYIWNKYGSNYYNWRKKREEWLDEQNFDPVKAERYQDGMMRSREKMQRKLDQEAEIHAAKQEERQKNEQDERIKQWEQFKVVSTSKAKQDSHKRGREFLPLGGGGSQGGGYRPARRQTGGGGGGGG